MNKEKQLSLSPVLLLFNLLFMFSGLILLVELHCKVNKTKNGILYSGFLLIIPSCGVPLGTDLGARV